jgi:hypothetical protein
MKTTLLLSLACAANAFTAPSTKVSSTKLLSSSDDAAPAPVASQDKLDELAMDELKAIAVAANPVVNYFDPIDLVNAPISETKTETIAWLRHAEIKHGRVAMAAFVGYWVQSQGITWNSDSIWPTDVGYPEAQWDALSTDLKYYVILSVGALEIIDEADQKGHYILGNKEPGRHPIFQRKTNASAEKLSEGKIKEINNGRLAMLGIMGFVSESSVPGSVPVLNGRIPAYTGQFWAPFQSDFSFFDNTVQVASAAATEATSSASELVSML